MQITISKLASIVIAFTYLLAAVAAEGIKVDLLPLLMSLAFVLALIWFPDEMGRVDKSRRNRFGGRVDNESPGVMVAGFGWFFLIGIPLIVVLIQWLSQ